MIVTTLSDLSWGQMHELMLALKNAGLSYEEAMRLMREPKLARRMVTGVFTEDVSPWKPPSWWTTEADQIEFARTYFSYFADLPSGIPAMPRDFRPRTPNGVPLLHLNIGGRIQIMDAGVESGAFPGYKLHDHMDFGICWLQSGFTWVEFDPTAHRGAHPLSVLGQPNLADNALYSAIVMFPEWVRRWTTPNASQRMPKPIFGHFHTDDKRFTLSASRSDKGVITVRKHYTRRAQSDYAMPTVYVL